MCPCRLYESCAPFPLTAPSAPWSLKDRFHSLLEPHRCTLSPRSPRYCFKTAVAPDSGAGARNPAYARDGRLAVSVQGDIWIVSTRGEWTRVTSGPAWDREPAWSADGSTIVFSSDRAGQFDLWRVAVGRAASRARATHDVAVSRRAAGHRARRPHRVRARPPRRGGAVGASTEWQRRATHEGSRSRAMAGDFGRWDEARVRLDRRRHAKAAHARARHGRRLRRAHRSAHRASRVVAGRRPIVVDRDAVRAAACTSRRSTDATSIS